MKKLNNNGFSIIEGLLIVIVLGVMGGVGFYVYKAAEATDKSSSNSNTSTQTRTDINEATQKSAETYTNKELKYVFEYPRTWTTSDTIKEASTYSGSTTHASTTIESKDLVTTNEGIGFHLTNGARMYVTVSETNSNTPSAYLDRSSFLKMTAQNRTPKEVAKHPAISYTVEYEGERSLNTIIINNNHLFNIKMDYANESALKTYQADYDSLIKSFKFIV